MVTSYQLVPRVDYDEVTLTSYQHIPQLQYEARKFDVPDFGISYQPESRSVDVDETQFWPEVVQNDIHIGSTSPAPEAPLSVVSFSNDS